MRLASLHQSQAIIILNVAGYYDGLVSLIQRAVEDGLISERFALNKVAVVVDEKAAKEAAAGTDKGFDWGKGKWIAPNILEIFADMLQPLSRQQ